MKAKQRKLQKQKEKQSNKNELNQNSFSQLSAVVAPQVKNSPAKPTSFTKVKNESKAPTPMPQSPQSTYINKQRQPDSPIHMPTEEEKSDQLQKMMKMFNIQNISLDIIHPEPSLQYNKWKEELKQLEEEIQIQQDKLEQQALKIVEENQMHKDDIDALDTELFNSGKGEVIALRESNKYYDSQISRCLNKLESMKNREIKDKIVDNKMRDDIQLTKMKLEREITEVRRIKEELLKIKKGTIPPNIRKQIEVMIKYCTSI